MINIVLSVIIIIMVVLFIFYKKKRDYELSTINSFQNGVAIGLTDNLKDEKAICESYKVRVKELEDGIKEGYGIAVRNEVTTIKCIFSKIELSYIAAGIYKLIESKDSSIEDKEYLIGLYKKIQSNIEQMKDPEES